MRDFLRMHGLGSELKNNKEGEGEEKRDLSAPCENGRKRTE